MCAIKLIFMNMCTIFKQLEVIDLYHVFLDLHVRTRLLNVHAILVLITSVSIQGCMVNGSTSSVLYSPIERAGWRLPSGLTNHAVKYMYNVLFCLKFF